jgi:hypothetical protein
MTPHPPASWLYLLLIPLVIGVRWWRARRTAGAADVWFEPEGGNFIYHPFGRFGAAYLVTPATRDAIRAKVRSFTQIAAVLIVIFAIGPITLLSVSVDLYMAWRPWLIWVRIGLVLALIPVGLLWHLTQVRPLYAGAPPAPRRITPESIRARRIAGRSWWALVVMLVTTSLVACGFCYIAYVSGNSFFLVYGVIFLILAGFNLRSVLIKRRLPVRS